MDKFSLRLRDATLTLKSGTLQDYKTTGGSIQVDGSAGTGSTLELQTTTINGNDLGSLNVDGLLEADNATANTIENFSAGDFTSDGKILVTANATLTLLDDLVTNTGGIIAVDDTGTLTLTGTTINGGTIDDYSGSAGGSIDVTGASKIAGSASLNDGAVTIETSQTLTLDEVTVSGTAFTIGDGATLELGVVTLPSQTINISFATDNHTSILKSK